MPLPTKVSDSFRRLNPHLFGTTEQVQGVIRATVEAHCAAKKRIRQKDGDGLNKTERAFLAYLRATYPGDTHYSQAFSLRLGNGANYRPDFISVRIAIPESAAERIVVRVRAWETKGFKREASAVRIKVAASLYPWIDFNLVTKQRKREGAGWSIQKIHP